MTVSRLNELGYMMTALAWIKILRVSVVGFSRNKEDPSGIGKFGFGMTAGSVSQCYRVGYTAGKIMDRFFIHI